MDSKTFESLGGIAMLEKVAKYFYDRIYEHPTLGQYFKHINQQHLESQQVNFISQSFGGPKSYAGKGPLLAHIHINITEKIYVLREKLLIESLDACNASEDLKIRWMTIDRAFKKGLIKGSLADCKKRFFTDNIIDFPH